MLRPVAPNYCCPFAYDGAIDIDIDDIFFGHRPILVRVHQNYYRKRTRHFIDLLYSKALTSQEFPVLSNV